jgi:uncharacterized protein YjbJ (UPF0337 family)
MNADQVADTWEVLEGKMQKRWGKLTGDDLDILEGRPRGNRVKRVRARGKA